METHGKKSMKSFSHHIIIPSPPLPLFNSINYTFTTKTELTTFIFLWESLCVSNILIHLWLKCHVHLLMSLVAWVLQLRSLPSCKSLHFLDFSVCPPTCLVSLLPSLSFLFFSFPQKNNSVPKTVVMTKHTEQHTHHPDLLFFPLSTYILFYSYIMSFFLFFCCKCGCFHQKKYEKIVSSLSYIPMYVFFLLSKAKQQSEKMSVLFFSFSSSKLHFFFFWGEQQEMVTYQVLFLIWYNATYTLSLFYMLSL